MPTRESQYLIQLEENGQFATVAARSHLGAVRMYLVRNPRTPAGSELRVKERDVDEEWITYRVDR